MRHTLTCSLVTLLAWCAPAARAQLLTVDSEADLYIAHIADGGPATSRWTTQFRFVNSGILTGAPAKGTLYFYADDGSPFPVDFGSGPATVFSISIPVGGSARAETTGAASGLREGFVRMVFDSPVQVTAEFRNFQNGVLVNGASVNGTTPSPLFWYAADAYTGIAVANPNSFAVNCTGVFLAPNGNTLASNTAIPVASLNHTAFTLGAFLSLPSSSVGSFQLSCLDALGNPASVASLAIAGDAHGITSSLPNSAGAVPVHHGEDIEKAFYYLVKVIRADPTLAQYAGALGQPQLVITPDNSQINACAERPQSAPPCNGPVGTVKIWLSLPELLSDSPSELAFVIAHELGHVVQLNLGNQTKLQMIFPLTSVNQTIETDADLFGFFAALAAGYDGYGVAGALGKLMMITGSATVNAQYEENIQALLGTDMHTSFLNRVNNLYITIQAACQASPTACQNYKNAIHPNFPVWAPLARPGIGTPE